MVVIPRCGANVHRENTVVIRTRQQRCRFITCLSFPNADDISRSAVLGRQIIESVAFSASSSAASPVRMLRVADGSRACDCGALAGRKHRASWCHGCVLRPPPTRKAGTRPLRVAQYSWRSRAPRSPGFRGGSAMACCDAYGNSKVCVQENSSWHPTTFQRGKVNKNFHRLIHGRCVVAGVRLTPGKGESRRSVQA